METQVAVAVLRVLMAFAEQMDTEQLRNAASAIRDLDGDESTRKFFNDCAEGLDEYVRARETD